MIRKEKEQENDKYTEKENEEQKGIDNEKGRHRNQNGTENGER